MARNLAKTLNIHTYVYKKGKSTHTVTYPHIHTYSFLQQKTLSQLQIYGYESANTSIFVVVVQKINKVPTSKLKAKPK